MDRSSSPSFLTSPQNQNAPRNLLKMTPTKTKIVPESRPNLFVFHLPGIDFQALILQGFPLAVSFREGTIYKTYSLLGIFHAPREKTMKTTAPPTTMRNQTWPWRPTRLAQHPAEVIWIWVGAAQI